ncbi:hypothetical protein AMAG_18383 [Allomyces macrogynus ATCC 38327]|uniref:Uncharacterized protein n=1 Tax=Allomyces macrogynus (strain ATCC 38327) TaxID=578462 RepID=A0A0L0S705_ALLM3|nr:hypothetical protein AMAG_18383 [Allomyces macrogynus ATCC 38327]|eukprot:KNE58176.1 hypothetical protein AMAG_18383 [Allomyces macrogynus ATCC 38327]
MVTLDQILPLLGPAASNEEKIAGLFALPNVVGPNDTEALRRVFAALDFEYLRKLLRAKGNDDSHVYHEVALNVLVAFAADETLAGTDQFHKCTKTIVKLLATLPISLVFAAPLTRQLARRRRRCCKTRSICCAG